jgi:tetratricopeptide (TPR) repeat protein
MPRTRQTHLTRRDFLQGAGILSVCGASWQPPSLPKTTDHRVAEAESLYKEASRLLLRGRQFERTAELLAQAATKNPDDYRFPAARGCALVSRSASLAYAAAHTEWLAHTQAVYPKLLSAWEMAQKDPDSERYGDPRPERLPARAFPTKDDGRPFRLTPEQTRKRLAELTADGRDAFLQAEERARTPEQKADWAYLYGWALRVLTLYADPLHGVTGPTPTGDNALLRAPDKKEVLRLMTAARDAAPDNPLYWRSLGDTLLWMQDDGADAAYERAAELAPRDALLLYHLYNRKAGRVNAIDGEPKAATEALDLLRRVRKADPANGWFSYEEAGLYFRQSKYSIFNTPSNRKLAPEQQQWHQKWYHTLATSAARQAGKQGVEAVERGNAAATCFVPLYRWAVPRFLQPVWGYLGGAQDVSFLYHARMRELARALSGYALYLAEQERNEPEATRACRAAMGIGRRLLGDWPTRDGYVGDPRVTDCLVGIAIHAIGLKMLIAVEEAAGTSDRVAAIQAEYAAFKERVKAHTAAVSQWLAQTMENPGVLY